LLGAADGKAVVIPMASRLTLKVIPGASQDKIVGMLGEALKIKVRAKPDRGKANAAVISLLAAFLELPERDIHICSGHTSKSKVVEIQGLSSAALNGKLSRIAT